MGTSAKKLTTGLSAAFPQENTVSSVGEYSKRNSSWSRNTPGWILPAILIAGWELLAQAGLIDTSLFSSPSQIAAELLKLTSNGELLMHLERLVAEAIAKVDLERFANALPRELSGGMAQRVAIARALVARPSLVLLDEPFSALDAFNRLKLQNHLLKIWETDRTTLLLVTHDVEEALVFGDRVIVLTGQPGRISQDFFITLPRPRRRADPEFQDWKKTILSALDLSLIADSETVEERAYVSAL
jgi:sulfonate transport system ATP-binding protein